MIEIHYEGEESGLVKILVKECPTLSYANIQKLLRKKDIKVNGVRVNKNVQVTGGSLIQVYASREMLEGVKVLAPVVYEDDNVLVLNKPSGVEVESKTVANDFTSAVNAYLKEKGQSARAVHRLDRNTKGLVMFAKNSMAYTELTKAIKEHKVDKFYFAEVFGRFNLRAGKYTAYLKKDAKKSLVSILAKPVRGYEQIDTEFELVRHTKSTSVVRVKLISGKTHQIRAHLSFLGFPIVGDTKYGNFELNRKLKEDRQRLTAYKIVFRLDKSSPLAYLNETQIEIDNNKA